MSPPYSILIVDDDKAMRQSLLDLIQAAGWQGTALSRATMVADHLASDLPDVILSDMRMPGMTGLDLLASLDPATAPPLVLISAHGDIPMAVQAMQSGAYSFVEKPYEPRRLLSILTHAADQHRMAQSNARLRARLFQLSGLDRVLLGQTPVVTKLRQTILDLAPTPASVLIRGETGTGKELVAKALHDLGDTPDAPFLALNCATLSPDQFQAEMFGVAGQTQGRLAAASGGTLFLDEICSCPLPVQAALLRVIEDQTILPVGATQPQPIQLRIVSATNEDPDTAIAENRLRADLFFRLNTMVLTLPPLRARIDDLPLLARHFLHHFARLYETEPPDLSAQDVATLLAHDWPGNVRELRNLCERRMLAARLGHGSMAEALHAAPPHLPDTLREAVAALERNLISNAVKTHAGRMDAAAEALGIGRRTLNEKIVKLGLDKDAIL